jgi:HlyD family secretion protein
MKRPLALAALALCGLATGCQERTPPPGYQGIVEYDERQAAFDVPGRIAGVAIERGDVVEPGQVLARLDDDEQQSARKVLVAELEAARAQAELLHAGSRPEEVRETRAQLEGARATVRHLRKELARNARLLQAGGVSPAKVDALEDDLARAEASAQVLSQRLQIMREGARSEEIRAADARAAAAQSAIERQDRHLERFQLRSPIGGQVLEIMHWTGEVVAAGTTVALLADTAHPFADAFVPQGELAGVKIGTAARVRVDSLETRLDGEVENVARETEFTPRFLFSPQERPNLVIRVRVRVDDPRRQLHAGVPAFVTFERNPAP